MVWWVGLLYTASISPIWNCQTSLFGHMKEKKSFHQNTPTRPSAQEVSLCFVLDLYFWTRMASWMKRWKSGCEKWGMVGWGEGIVNGWTQLQNTWAGRGRWTILQLLCWYSFRQKISKASSAFLPFLLSRLTFYLYRINSIFYPVGPILSTCNINRQKDATHTHTFPKSWVLLRQQQ